MLRDSAKDALCLTVLSSIQIKVWHARFALGGGIHQIGGVFVCRALLGLPVVTALDAPIAIFVPQGHMLPWEVHLV